VTEHERIGASLAEMGTEVRRAVAPPPAGAVRHRAERQQRVRRTATAALAAAAVLAIAVGAVSVVRGSDALPPPPATTQTPTPSPTPSPGPKPTQWAAPKVTDPIAATDWKRATITLPEHEGCPSGRLRFAPGGLSGEPRSSGWPQVSLEPTNIVYADLTGDGRAEAILVAFCLLDESDSGDGQGQLLVVRRVENQLRALGWVGPRGYHFIDYWVEDGVLYADGRPWYTPLEYKLGNVPAYRWTGSTFATAGAARYPALAPGVPFDLTPVPGRTGCPTPVLRFGRDGRASVDGVTLDLQQPQLPDVLPHLVDLEGDGKRRLLITITCGRQADGNGGTTAVVVLERTDGGGFVALDAIRLPEGTRTDGSGLFDWDYSRGELSIDIDGQGRRETYVWDGERFQG
jgi:hypothetical protein